MLLYMHPVAQACFARVRPPVRHGYPDADLNVSLHVVCIQSSFRHDQPRRHSRTASPHTAASVPTQGREWTEPPRRPSQRRKPPHASALPAFQALLYDMSVRGLTAAEAGARLCFAGAAPKLETAPLAASSLPPPHSQRLRSPPVRRVPLAATPAPPAPCP